MCVKHIIGFDLQSSVKSPGHCVFMGDDQTSQPVKFNLTVVCRERRTRREWWETYWEIGRKPEGRGNGLLTRGKVMELESREEGVVCSQRAEVIKLETEGKIHGIRREQNRTEFAEGKKTIGKNKIGQ